jgi:hypothetical protein
MQGQRGVAGRASEEVEPSAFNSRQMKNVSESNF